LSLFALSLLFIAFWIAATGFYIYFSNRKNEINSVFFIMALFWAYWYFIEFGLQTSESIDMVAAWQILGALRMGVVPLMLHFILLYTNRITQKIAVPIHLSLYLPILAITVLEVCGTLFWYEPVRFVDGWIISRNNVFINGFFTGWILTICSLTLMTIFIYFRQRSDETQKTDGRFTALAAIGPTVFGLISSILGPLTLYAPRLYTLNGLIIMGACTVLVYRRNIFSISPGSAAEDILAVIPDALFITTLEGAILRVNSSAEAISGYGRNGIRNLHIDRLFSDGFAVDLYGKTVTSGQNVWSREALLRTKNSEEIPVYVTSCLIRKTKKRIPVAMVIICRDRSFEKKALDEFGKTEQLETLGFLAGGIAHDFNNLLTSITAYLSLARTNETISESMRQTLDKVESAARMVINLNRQLAGISKKTMHNRELCSIAEIIQNAVQLALSGSPIECRTVIASDLHSVEGDATQLNQVFLNLLVNARQAMERGGVIGVEAGNTSIDGSSGIEVSITDQGCGIQVENIDDIFKPFFTTKKKGTGLGLSVVRSVVESHGGTIAVTTCKDVGTTFTVRLPARSGSAATDRKTEQAEPMARSSNPGRILVMDDEEGVKRAIILILTKSGHTVIGTDHGAEAISTYLKNRSEGTPFDLIILDVTVRNGYGAQEVIKRLREIDPHVCAIVMSGYRESPLIRDYRSYGFIDVIPKPFDAVRINNVVNRALELQKSGQCG